MTRLIDANAIDKRYVPIAPVIEGDAVHYEWIVFVEDINEQQTIDAEPVRHGKWMEMIEVNELGEPYQPGVYCSECGHTDCCEPNYCPNCGARMDEE